MDLKSLREGAIWSDDKGHCGAIAEWLQKHMAMATEEQEAPEPRVWGDSFHSSTGIPHYSGRSWLTGVG